LPVYWALSSIVYTKKGRSQMQHERGFTLLELMIVVVVVAVLAGIALPSYSDYMLRGKFSEATGNLADLRVKMEQAYGDNRRYNDPIAGVGTLRRPGRQHAQRDGQPLLHLHLRLEHPEPHRRSAVRADRERRPGGGPRRDFVLGRLQKRQGHHGHRRIRHGEQGLRRRRRLLGAQETLGLLIP
jgi:prepilin-type N-terminal cleavage/methylation domain-containing protein